MSQTSTDMTVENIVHNLDWGALLTDNEGNQFSTDRDQDHSKLPCDFVCARCQETIITRKYVYFLVNAGGQDGLFTSVWVTPRVLLNQAKSDFHFGGIRVRCSENIDDINPDKGASFRLIHNCRKVGEIHLGYLYQDGAVTPRSKYKCYRFKVFVHTEEGVLMLTKGPSNLEEQLGIAIKAIGRLTKWSGPKQRVERRLLNDLPDESRKLMEKYKAFGNNGDELEVLAHLLRETPEGQLLQKLAGVGFEYQELTLPELKQYFVFFKRYMERDENERFLRIDSDFPHLKDFFVRRFIIAIRKSRWENDKTKGKKQIISEHNLEAIRFARKVCEHFCKSEPTYDVVREVLNLYKKHPKLAAEGIEEARAFFANNVNVDEAKNVPQGILLVNMFYMLNVEALKEGTEQNWETRADDAKKYFESALYPSALRVRVDLARKGFKDEVFQRATIWKDLAKIGQKPRDDRLVRHKMKELLQTLMMIVLEDPAIIENNEYNFHQATKADVQCLLQLAEEVEQSETKDKLELRILSAILKFKLPPGDSHTYDADAFHKEMRTCLTVFLEKRSSTQLISASCAYNLADWVAIAPEGEENIEWRIAQFNTLWSHSQQIFEQPKSSDQKGVVKVDIGHFTTEFTGSKIIKHGCLDGIAIWKRFEQIEKEFAKLSLPLKKLEQMELVVGQGIHNERKAPQAESDTQEIAKDFFSELLRNGGNKGCYLIPRNDLADFFNDERETIKKICKLSWINRIGRIQYAL